MSLSTRKRGAGRWRLLLLMYVPVVWQPSRTHLPTQANLRALARQGHVRPSNAERGRVGQHFRGQQRHARPCAHARAKRQRSTRPDWTNDWQSKEHAAFALEGARYLVGMRCNGRHCDNKRYRHCAPRPAAGTSCETRCGNNDPNLGCQCATACTRWNDCCPTRSGSTANRQTARPGRFETDRGSTCARFRSVHESGISMSSAAKRGA